MNSRAPIDQGLSDAYKGYAATRLSSGRFGEMGSWPLIYPYVRGLKTLDVGCSDGLYLRYMTADSVGIEQMPELAERARTQGLNVICGDLMSVVNSMPECEYDAVLLSHVLEHVENPIELLRAAHRLLKPGGRLVLGLPTERNVFRNLLRLDYFDGTHLYSFSIRNSFKLLEYVGFRPMHTCFHLPKYRGKSGERIHRIWNRLPFISKEWWSMAYWIIAEKN